MFFSSFSGIYWHLLLKSLPIPPFFKIALQHDSTRWKNSLPGNQKSNTG